MKRKMNKTFFVTGSTVFGIPTKDSDIDIVMLDETIGIVISTLNLLAIPYKRTEETRNYRGITFQIPNLCPIHIIFAKTKAIFNEWYIATEELKQQPRIKNKKLRVQAFIEAIAIARAKLK